MYASRVEWFWKRRDLYRENGRCVYADICSQSNKECDPEKCEMWEKYFDSECQADEILSDSE